MPRSGLHFLTNIRGVAKVRARVHDDGNGMYRVRWKPTLSVSIALSLDGYALPGSPCRRCDHTRALSIKVHPQRGRHLSTR